jgi:hypothetical protein
MQVAVLLMEVLPHQAQPILAVVAAEVCTTERIIPLALVVQADALLGIGVKHGTLCKN